jgi:hypothetical protein
MEHPDGPHRGRESFLALLFATGCGGGFLLFLILVSGGFFFYVLCAATAVTGLGALHYFLWGRTFSQEIAGERQAQELRERQEADEPRNGPPAGRRF